MDPIHVQLWCINGELYNSLPTDWLNRLDLIDWLTSQINLIRFQPIKDGAWVYVSMATRRVTMSDADDDDDDDLQLLNHPSEHFHACHQTSAT